MSESKYGRVNNDEYEEDAAMELGDLQDENPYLPPFFKWNSFTIYVSALEIVYFVVSLFVRKEKTKFFF